MKKTIAVLFFIFHFSFFIPCSSQIISTIAGNGIGGYSGDGGAATAAELAADAGVKVDDSGNVYIADSPYVIRKVNTLGIISTVAGNGLPGYSGDGGAATAAEIGSLGIGVDNAGNIYIAGGTCIRKVNTSGIISTFAGLGVGGYSGDGGAATAAELMGTRDVAVDGSGNVYIVDEINHRIRKVNTAGVISTFAGNGYYSGMSGQGGYSGDGGPATAAELARPSGVAVDVLGNVYIADFDNSRIREVNTLGIISTYAGGSSFGTSGNGGPATAAELGLPVGVATDDSGNVYISDLQYRGIRKVNTSGIISAFAGNGIEGYSGDGGAATAAEVNASAGIATDIFGNVYIVDGGNARVRKVTYDTTTGIKELKVESGELRVYPNPNKGEFTVSITSTDVSTKNLEIYTIMGQKIFNEPLLNAQSDNTINLNTEADGLYFYRVMSENGNLIGEGKLIIEN